MIYGFVFVPYAPKFHLQVLTEKSPKDFQNHFPLTYNLPSEQDLLKKIENFSTND